MEETWFDIIRKNTSGQYITALIIFLSLLLIYFLYKLVLVDRLNNKFKQNDLIKGLITTISNLLSLPVIILTGFWLMTFVLELPELMINMIYWIFLLTFSLYLLYSLFEFIEILGKIVKNKTKQAHMVDFLEFTLRILITIIVVLWILHSIGININSFLAGLGIFGLGFAFALQNVFSDLFASITIFVDRPFEIGDTIRIGEDIGTVEKIGLKSTQLRTPLGNQLIISNQELTNQRIHNMKRMNKRKVDFILGVSYETPVNKLEKIPNWIEEIINNHKDTEFEFAYFTEMASSSLNYRIVYFINNSNAQNWLSNQQSINIEILRKFNDENIDIPYPTQKIIS